MRLPRGLCKACRSQGAWGAGVELGRLPEAATPGAWDPTEWLRLQGRAGICACGPRACCGRRLLPLRAGAGPVPLRQVRDRRTESLLTAPARAPALHSVVKLRTTSPTPPVNLWAARGGISGQVSADLALVRAPPPWPALPHWANASPASPSRSLRCLDPHSPGCTVVLGGCQVSLPRLQTPPSAQEPSPPFPLVGTRRGSPVCSSRDAWPILGGGG